MIAGAQPGTVVVDRRLAQALCTDATFSLTELGRRTVKGVGEIELFRLASADPA